MSRIFISHSSENNAAALALTMWLKAKGWSDYFLDIDINRGIAPGERWMAALAAAVDRCEAVLFLVSPAWRASKYCFAEFYQAKNLGKRIIGIIIEPIPLSELPEQMTSEWQICDLTDSHDLVSFNVCHPPIVPKCVVKFPRIGLEVLQHGLERAGLDASTFIWPPQQDPQRSPYPGLRALDDEDAAVFFGRDAFIVRAIDQLRLLRERGIEHIFVIIGASGAGKSSFLRAGLLPRLKRDVDHFVVLPPVRPQRAVISGSHGLIASLQNAFNTFGQSISRADLELELTNTGLTEILRRITIAASKGRPTIHSINPTLIIPIDQSEELYSSEGDVEARQFLSLIDSLRHHLIASPSSENKMLKVILVLTIRSDSLPKLQTDGALQALTPVFFSLPAMPIAEFKEVINGPAKRHTEAVKPLTINPKLIERMTDKAKGADALPLLALTLEWLYREFTTSEGTQIGLEEYNRLGGERRVIDMAVKHAFENPGNEPTIPTSLEEQERLLLSIFPHIATVDPDTGERKRRVTERDKLRSKIPQADAMVSRLIEQRLLLSDIRSAKDNGKHVEVVEVAHEALLRQWETLQHWLKELSADLVAAESLRRFVNDWLHEKDDDVLLLHTGYRLEAAEALLANERLKERFDSDDHAYVTACRKRQRRLTQEHEEQLQQIAQQQSARARLQKRVSWLITTATIIVFGLSAWIIVQLREINLQTSQLLASGAEAAAEAKLYDRALRLGVLAMKSSWLHQPHPTAAPTLARAADGSMLHALIVGDKFSQDCKRFVVTSAEMMQVFDVESGKPIGKAMENDNPITHAYFSPDMKRVVGTWKFSQKTRETKIWDVETGKHLFNPFRFKFSQFSKFTPDGKRVLTKPLHLQVFNLETGEPFGMPIKGSGNFENAMISPNGVRVVTKFGNLFQVWDVVTGKPVGEPIKDDSGYSSRANFSLDSKRVFIISENVAYILNAITGKPLVQLKLNSLILSANFSPDGKLLKTTESGGFSEGSTSQVWDVESGEPSGVQIKHGNATFSQFSLNGKRLITSSMRKNKVQIWDTEMGKPIGEEPEHDGYLGPPKFTPDGKRVVTASENVARDFDVETGMQVGEALNHDADIRYVNFSTDGHSVVTSTYDGISLIWDIESSKNISKQIKYDDQVGIINFSPDGKKVITTSKNKAWILDVDTGDYLGIPMNHESLVESAKFSPDGKLIVTTSLDGVVRIWDAKTGMPVSKLMNHDFTVFSADFSLNANHVLTLSSNQAQVWEVETGKPLGKPITYDFAINSAKFSPDGKHVVTTTGNMAQIRHLHTGESIAEPIMHEDYIESVNFSPNGMTMITSSQDNTAQIWDVESGKPIGEPMNHDSDVYSAIFNSNGNLVIIESLDGTVQVWSAETGEAVGKPMKHDFLVETANFCPDGNYVVTQSVDNTLRVWDVDKGYTVKKPMMNNSDVNFTSISPDGSRGITMSSGIVQVWNVETGKKINGPMRNESEVIYTNFSRYGRYVLTASKNNTAQV
ncbi:MAG: TIR domain-containing protein [Candidatus Thiodiazotropha sp. (ex Ctena orbiculata)]|nr:TIR domain-containing protein [Candidatus Thiodiazotropha taylori]